MIAVRRSKQSYPKAFLATFWANVKLYRWRDALFAVAFGFALVAVPALFVVVFTDFSFESCLRLLLAAFVGAAGTQFLLASTKIWSFTQLGLTYES